MTTPFLAFFIYILQHQNIEVVVGKKKVCTNDTKNLKPSKKADMWQNLQG